MRTISRSCTKYCGNNSRSESTCGLNLYGVCSILRPTGEQREIQSRSTTRDFVQRERIPKDVYFFYRSVYITERRHEFRACNVPFVKVYSNADAVELCINDVSHGRISRSELPDNESTVFVWENIKIKPGTKNKICAKAYFSDGTSRTDYAFWTGK